MELGSGPEEERFRDEVESFVREAWRVSPEQAADSEAPLDAAMLEAFRVEATRRGFVYRGIPEEYGGSGAPPDPVREKIVAEVFYEAGVRAVVAGPREHMIVHTLLEHGSPELCERYVRRTLDCEITWCQGYSEPGAGSDLAALQSRAVVDGDEWVIDGHKVWTSGAHESSHMFGLFRTDPEARKHAGITYLLLEMDQPGVRVRPLVQLDGGDDFNEVFFDGARTALSNQVGERGAGWQVSRATLKHERAIIGNPNFMRDRMRNLMALVRRSRVNGRPALEQSSVRQRLADLEARIRCLETANMRQLTAEVRGDPSVAGLLPIMLKLYSTDVEALLVGLAYDLVGDSGMESAALSPLGAPARTDRDWVRSWLFALGSRLGGGASNIQRNIVGERGLGLPRDLRTVRASK